MSPGTLRPVFLAFSIFSSGLPGKFTKKALQFRVIIVKEACQVDQCSAPVSSSGEAQKGGSGLFWSIFLWCALGAAPGLWCCMREATPQKEFPDECLMRSLPMRKMFLESIVPATLLWGAVFLGASSAYGQISVPVTDEGTCGKLCSRNYWVMVPSLDEVRTELEVGEGVAGRDSSGATPLHWAAEAGTPDAVKLLLEAGADVTLYDTANRTPLHYAARSPFTESAQLLLEAGADVEALDVNRQTPLHVAASNPTPGLVEFLLAGGGYVAAADKYGETPLHLAAGFGSAASVEAILKAGADMEARTVYGWTPLHAAAWHGNPEAVRVFLGAGANPRARALGGQTPLDFALASQRRGGTESYRLLQQARAQ